MLRKRTQITRRRKKTLSKDYFRKRYVASNSATLLVSAAGSVLVGALAGLLGGGRVWLCIVAALAGCFVSELAHLRGGYRK